MTRITEELILDAIEKEKCNDCGTRRSYVVAGYMGFNCRCEADKLVGTPANKAAVKMYEGLFKDKTI